MRVAGRRELSHALIGCGVPHLGKAAEHPRFKAELAVVMTRVVNVRRLGCASLDLGYVANGRFDAFWERGLHSWDIAAGELIVREAGGFVSDGDGEADYLEDGRYLVRQRVHAPRDAGAAARRVGGAPGVIPGLTRAPAATLA